MCIRDRIYIQAIGNYDTQTGTAIAAILLSVTLVVFILQKAILDKRSYVTLTGKASRVREMIEEMCIRDRAKTNIRLDILKKIHEAVDIPLVLHGGTGVRDDDVRECVRLGMHKLNFGTELNVSWVRKAKEVFAEAEPDDTMRNLMIECNQAMTETIQKKIQLVRF